MADSPLRTVNIRPGVSILSVLQHLNYRPWFAFAEFVDNALASYLSNRAELDRLAGDGPPLKVSIEFSQSDGQVITIRDNAAGIADTEFERAFRPAALPADRSGLSEFGMGMKSASCWFSSEWTVTTTALGQPFKHSIVFDINEIIDGSRETVEVRTADASKDEHFTVITLWNLHRQIQGRTLGKIREHLASIYREFIRQGILELRVGALGEPPLKYESPDVLVAPYFKSESADQIVWRKEIAFDFGLGLSCSGFAALRSRASTTEAGFALFRRNRLIQGSGDEGYRPEAIFRKSNSFTYQRLFGELHLTGFEVSHTKDGFRWDDNEDVFLELLKEHLDTEPTPLLRQAEGFRAKPKPLEILPEAHKAARSTADALQKGASPEIDGQLLPDESAADEKLKCLDTAEPSAKTAFVVDLADGSWEVQIEVTTDPSVLAWLTVGAVESPKNASKQSRSRLHIRVSLANRFMERFGGSAAEDLEPMLRIAAALALAEVTARFSGVRGASTVVRNVNQYLSGSLADP